MLFFFSQANVDSAVVPGSVLLALIEAECRKVGVDPEKQLLELMAQGFIHEARSSLNSKPKQTSQKFVPSTNYQFMSSLFFPMTDSIGEWRVSFCYVECYNITCFLALDQAKTAALAHREQLLVSRGQSHGIMAKWDKRFCTIESDVAVLYFANAGDIFPTNFLSLCIL